MLNSKQRAFLKAISSTQNTILIIGKGGVTDDVINQALEALKARELIKVKILKESTDLDLKTAANIVAEKTNSEIVQIIGSKFILYKKNPEKTILKLPK